MLGKCVITYPFASFRCCCAREKGRTPEVFKDGYLRVAVGSGLLSEHREVFSPSSDGSRIT